MKQEQERKPNLENIETEEYKQRRRIYQQSSKPN